MVRLCFLIISLLSKYTIKIIATFLRQNFWYLWHVNFFSKFFSRYWASLDLEHNHSWKFEVFSVIWERVSASKKSKLNKKIIVAKIVIIEFNCYLVQLQKTLTNGKRLNLWLWSLHWKIKDSDPQALQKTKKFSKII